MLQHDSHQLPSAALTEPGTKPGAAASFQVHPLPWRFQGFATDADPLPQPGSRLAGRRGVRGCRVRGPTAKTHPLAQSGVCSCSAALVSRGPSPAPALHRQSHHNTEALSPWGQHQGSLQSRRAWLQLPQEPPRPGGNRPAPLPVEAMLLQPRRWMGALPHPNRHKQNRSLPGGRPCPGQRAAAFVLPSPRCLLLPGR